MIDKKARSEASLFLLTRSINRRNSVYLLQLVFAQRSAHFPFPAPTSIRFPEVPDKSLHACQGNDYTLLLENSDTGIDTSWAIPIPHSLCDCNPLYEFITYLLYWCRLRRRSNDGDDRQTMSRHIRTCRGFESSQNRSLEFERLARV